MGWRRAQVETELRSQTDREIEEEREREIWRERWKLLTETTPNRDRLNVNLFLFLEHRLLTIQRNINKYYEGWVKPERLC